MTKMTRRIFLKTLGVMFGSAAAARVAPLLAQDVLPADSMGVDFEGEITFWDWDFDPRAEFFGTLIENWQGANESVSLNYQRFGYGDLQTRILTAGASETTPPLANIHSFWRYPLQKAGRLEPYPADLFNYDDLLSTTYNRDADGNIYTSTFGYYCDIVYYNEDLLTEAGYTPQDIPDNWEDFMQFSRELTLLDDRDRVVRPGCALNHYYSQEWLWSSMVYQLGGYLYNEDGTRAQWDSPEGVEALEMIRSWYNDNPIDDPNLLRHYEQFGNGEAVMFISHGYWAPTIPTDYPDLNWGTKAIPTFTGDALPSYGLIVPEEGLGVFADYPDDVKAAAFDFIQYALGPQEHRQRWSVISTAPSDLLTLEMNTLAEQDPGGAIAAQAETLPYRVNYGERPVEAEAAWREMFESVIIAGEDVQTAATRANDRINDVFANATDPYIITERNYIPPTE